MVLLLLLFYLLFSLSLPRGVLIERKQNRMELNFMRCNEYIRAKIFRIAVFCVSVFIKCVYLNLCVFRLFYYYHFFFIDKSYYRPYCQRMCIFCCCMVLFDIQSISECILMNVVMNIVHICSCIVQWNRYYYFFFYGKRNENNVLFGLHSNSHSSINNKYIYK